jgi:type VI secretion system protein ImpK
MRLVDCFAEILAFTVDFLKKASTEQPSLDSVVERYDALVTRSRERRAEGRFSDDDWRESFFAVCCFVDESILCSDWPERVKWSAGHQLQHRHFNTANGGDEFFSHLEGLGENAYDVREVYGSCLALGFKGRFFDPKQQKGLSDIIHTNFTTVAADHALLSRLFLFPSAYGVQRSKKERSFGIYVVMFFAAVLPVACFTALYFFYGKILDRMVFQYFH